MNRGILMKDFLQDTDTGNILVLVFIISFIITALFMASPLMQDNEVVRDQYMLKEHNAVWSSEEKAYILKIDPEIKKIKKIEFLTKPKE